jgi:hypothetical protein
MSRPSQDHVHCTLAVHDVGASIPERTRIDSGKNGLARHGSNPFE